jgi:glyoxylase-like metal-dependent hydrolase (beta-lactamase superfamily II)
MPGHTKGSAAYLVDGVLFFGDIAGHTKEDHVKRAPWVFSDDTATAAKSIQRLAALLKPDEVRAFAFAHSGPLTPADLKKLADVD